MDITNVDDQMTKRDSGMGYRKNSPLSLYYQGSVLCKKKGGGVLSRQALSAIPTVRALQ
ncbi:hypothetical protein [Alicyclobacillus sp. ALC3]|uniref:hypothetical protein n=1 Tax=Alicyclobacillus sp. ALC3 TaxID=2796143 RepID=UPI002378BAD8|nr:hypothetical protein [Alicyclobacillus sp. ALC3]WDL98275.1 hypothetical protein JC200_06180 [Alicyclobacillus sp. ALC3]